MSANKRGVAKSTPKKAKLVRPKVVPTYDLGLDSVLRTGRTLDRRLIGNNFSALAPPLPHTSPAPTASSPPKSPPPPLALHPCLVQLSPQRNLPTRDFLLTSRPSGIRIASPDARLFPNVAVAGCCEIFVLRGAVSVLGHRITHLSGPLPLFSAPLGSFLTVVKPVVSVARENEAALGMAVEAALEDAIAALMPEECYALIRLSALEKAQTPCLGVVPKLPLPTTGLFDGPAIVPGLFIPSVETKYRPFQSWLAWPDVVSALSKSSSSAMRILSCGEHGSGKSMLARCVVNHLLNSFQEIMFVDTDIGQPELSPSGMVSASIVRNPLLGPPASHNTYVPLFSSFVGETTPREQISQYSAALSIVISSARRYTAENNVPMIVNSDGWVSGAGAELHDMILRMVEPTQIFASTTEEVDDGKVVGMINPSRAVANLQSAGFPSHYVTVLKAPYAGDVSGAVVPASMLREMSLSCYFSNAPVRSVCLTDVNVSFLGEAIAGQLVLAALRSMSVAIAVTNASVAPIAWRILGFGLIRAVDPDSLTLFIASPLSDADLELCDGLIASRNIVTPSHLIRDFALQDHSCCIPYVVSNVRPGAHAMKSRSTLNRH